MIDLGPISGKKEFKCPSDFVQSKSRESGVPLGDGVPATKI